MEQATVTVQGVLDIRRCFRDARDVYMHNVWILIVLFAALTVLGIMSAGIVLGMFLPRYYYAMLSAMRSGDKKISLEVIFKWEMFFTLIIFVLAKYLIVWLCSQPGLFVLPGIFVGTIWLFGDMLILDKPMNIPTEGMNLWQKFRTVILRVVRALTLSTKIVFRKGFFKNLLLGLIPLVLGGITIALAALAGVNETLVAFLSMPLLLVFLAVMPFTMLLVVSGYVQQVDEDDGKLKDLF